MFSADLPALVKWNGKGIPRDEETARIKDAVEKAHQQQNLCVLWSTRFSECMG